MDRQRFESDARPTIKDMAHYQNNFLTKNAATNYGSAIVVGT